MRTERTDATILYSVIQLHPTCWIAGLLPGSCRNDCWAKIGIGISAFRAYDNKIRPVHDQWVPCQHHNGSGSRAGRGENRAHYKQCERLGHGDAPPAGPGFPGRLAAEPAPLLLAAGVVSRRGLL